MPALYHQNLGGNLNRSSVTCPVEWELFVTKEQKMINASPKLCFNTDKLALPQNFQFPLRAETSLAQARFNHNLGH